MYSDDPRVSEVPAMGPVARRDDRRRQV